MKPPQFGNSRQTRVSKMIKQALSKARVELKQEANEILSMKGRGYKNAFSSTGNNSLWNVVSDFINNK